ncbi:MAG: methyl-accepting chemotaxis protein [Sphaerochaetaceae bacterium]|nr:methyl-accepting chemotaxis protein [Sphaerochaetaceae bacterium]
MKNVTIKMKLVVIVVCTIIVVSMSMFVAVITSINSVNNKNIDYYTKEAFSSKLRSIKSLVSLQMKSAESIYEEFKSGLITENEAKEKILKDIANARYEGKNYFWVQDKNYFMLTHPSEKLAQNDISDVKDPNGKAFFKEISILAKKNNSGSLQYVWPKQGEAKPIAKYTYFEVFEPFDWIIATGSYLDDVERNVAKMQEVSSEQMMRTIWEIILIVILLIVVMTIIVTFISNKMIVKPIHLLTGTVKALTKYSSAEQKINIDSKDEIGELAKYFNEYLANIRAVTAQDQKIVEESEKAIQMVRAGFFIYKVNSTSSNRSTNDLKNSINNLIDDMNEKLTTINNALGEYSKGNFDYDVNIGDVSGTIGSMVNTTKSIGDNVSEIMATILISGEKLAENIDVLSTSSSHLSSSSNEQAASLEETAAAVEEINGNIRSNTERISQMKVIEEDVLSHATEGEELAKRTVVSMDEINSEVTAINEAISVIDQIAFQTNILSLNAAVEAATAGEAGKGFAVVAGEVRNLASRSAEAANEIKTLVESANAKANSGKHIADEMIAGYTNLQNAIAKTKQIIDDVANASKEQEIGISQINDAINTLDKNTQENASEASNIAGLSNEVKELSERLLIVANNAKFKAKAREQISDMKLVDDLNNLKLQHIIFKDTSFAKLKENTKFTVKSPTECNLGKWIIQMENENKPFTKMQNWTELKAYHEAVHGGVQNYVDNSCDDATNEKLIDIGNGIEDATRGVFSSLDKIKIEVSKGLV